ncbi:MAG: hypothetical protein ACO225_10515 [Ilumatobacteraceae bacterium]
MTRLDRLLHDALAAAGEQVEPTPDLFDRITADISADRARRRLRRRAAVAATGVATAVTAAISLIIYRQGEPHMDWWILELIAFAVLATIALLLGPFIKRFGRSYAADVFRSNPGTGKSFIVLTDFAYYLIFTAYIAFTTQVDRPSDWASTVSAEQVQFNIARLGGILLIIGLLHGVNLLVLPIIGRLLTLNRRLDQQMREHASRDLADGGATDGSTGRGAPEL